MVVLSDTIVTEGCFVQVKRVKTAMKGEDRPSSFSQLLCAPSHAPYLIESLTASRAGINKSPSLVGILGLALILYLLQGFKRYLTIGKLNLDEIFDCIKELFTFIINLGVFIT